MKLDSCSIQKNCSKWIYITKTDNKPTHLFLSGHIIFSIAARTQAMKNINKFNYIILKTESKRNNQELKSNLFREENILNLYN